MKKGTVKVVGKITGIMVRELSGKRHVSVASGSKKHGFSIVGA